MRIRQMGFSSKLKAHKNIVTLETIRFISEFLVDRNARHAALRSGIPETYASRYGQWLKKHPAVLAALEQDLDERELLKLRQSIAEIDLQISHCLSILGMNEKRGSRRNSPSKNIGPRT
jgi:phage terminase small subunit